MLCVYLFSSGQCNELCLWETDSYLALVKISVLAESRKRNPTKTHFLGTAVPQSANATRVPGPSGSGRPEATGHCAAGVVWQRCTCTLLNTQSYPGLLSWAAPRMAGRVCSSSVPATAC